MMILMPMKIVKDLRVAKYLRKLSLFLYFVKYPVVEEWGHSSICIRCSQDWFDRSCSKSIF